MTASWHFSDIRAMTVRDRTAFPNAMLKHVNMEVGGAFGGKGIQPPWDPVAAVLSKKTGRSIKLVVGRR